MLHGTGVGDVDDDLAARRDVDRRRPDVEVAELDVDDDRLARRRHLRADADGCGDQRPKIASTTTLSRPVAGAVEVDSGVIVVVLISRSSWLLL